MMYYNYQHAAAAAPINALSGVARALEEGHLPFDLAIFNHPEIHADRVSLNELMRYRLVLLPSLECLADSQIELLTKYLQGGGTLGIVDPSQCGARDEDNIPRSQPPVEAWKKIGKVVEILPDHDFLPCRAKENDQTQEITRIVIERTREALDGATILSGDLPRMLWAKAWEHGDELVSIHFVNYDMDFESGKVASTQPVEITITLPANVRAEEVVWLTPDGERQTIAADVDGQQVKVVIPSVRVYGILVIGRKGLDKKHSDVLHGDALLARAEMACDGSWDSLSQQAAAAQEMSKRCAEGVYTVREASEYAQASDMLLRSVQKMQYDAYMERIQKAAAANGAVLALDFGGTQEEDPWRAVGVDSVYSQDTGFGWLPQADGSAPTPEEKYYAMAQRYGSKVIAEITASSLLFWPYREQPPSPLRTNLACGAPGRFRIDVPNGDYTVSVVTTNPSWTHRNFLVSGMVSVNGTVQLLDTVHDRGALVAREFSISAAGGKLEFTFGGPTGWAVAALIIKPGSHREVDPQIAYGLRKWHISPRYQNSDWYPITQVSCGPEKRLNSLPEDDWVEVESPSDGLPVIDLGTNQEAEIGDIVYAVSTIQAPVEKDVLLHFGASSQSQLWLNGEPVGYLPNEKGLRRDEWVVSLRLQKGENRLVAKLQRFWERRWMFYASLIKSSNITQ